MFIQLRSSLTIWIPLRKGFKVRYEPVLLPAKFASMNTAMLLQKRRTTCSVSSDQWATDNWTLIMLTSLRTMYWLKVMSFFSFTAALHLNLEKLWFPAITVPLMKHLTSHSAKGRALLMRIALNSNLDSFHDSRTLYYTLGSHNRCIRSRKLRT